MDVIEQKSRLFENVKRSSRVEDCRKKNGTSVPGSNTLHAQYAFVECQSVLIVGAVLNPKAMCKTS